MSKTELTTLYSPEFTRPTICGLIVIRVGEGAWLTFVALFPPLTTEELNTFSTLYLLLKSHTRRNINVLVFGFITSPVGAHSSVNVIHSVGITVACSAARAAAAS